MSRQESRNRGERKQHPSMSDHYLNRCGHLFPTAITPRKWTRFLCHFCIASQTGSSLGTDMDRKKNPKKITMVTTRPTLGGHGGNIHVDNETKQPSTKHIHTKTGFPAIVFSGQHTTEFRGRDTHGTVVVIDLFPSHSWR